MLIGYIEYLIAYYRSYRIVKRWKGEDSSIILLERSKMFMGPIAYYKNEVERQKYIAAAKAIKYRSSHKHRILCESKYREYLKNSVTNT